MRKIKHMRKIKKLTAVLLVAVMMCTLLSLIHISEPTRRS